MRERIVCSVEADCKVPILQALAMALTLGFAVFAVLLVGGVFSVGIAFHVPWWWHVICAIVCVPFLTVACGFAWLLPPFIKKRQEFVMMLERATKLDLNKDSVVGRPPPDRPLTLVFGAPQQKTREQRFVEFVQGCEHSTAQNYWEGPPRRLSREDYINFRDTLIRLGWAKWRNSSHPNQGWELLFTPEQIIDGALRRAPHPTDAAPA